MTKKRRSTDRHRVVLVVLMALTIGALVIPASSYTTAELCRSGSIDVAADLDGLLTLDIADAVCAGETDRLVTITNGFDREVTVTVILTTDTATFDSGDSKTTPLSIDETAEFDVTVDDAAGDTVAFSVEADGTGLSATADRTVPIEECAA